MKNRTSSREQKLQERRIKKDVNKLVRLKANTVSFTISPSSKHNNEIESLETAIEYYKDLHKEGLNIDGVYIQEKYMGSYVDLYLFPNDLDRSYMLSRGGFIITETYLNKNKKEEHKTTIRELIQPIFDKLIEDDFNKMALESTELIIIGCELTPWGTISKQYMEKDFYRYDIMQSRNLDHRKEYENLLIQSLNNKDLNDLSKDHIRRYYNNLDTLLVDRGDIDYMEKQVSKYGTLVYGFSEDDIPKLNPFKTYKYVFIDSTECVYNEIPKQLEVFYGKNFISFDELDTNYINKAKEYQSKILSKGIVEGVIVRPSYRNHSKCDINHAPCFKVRTKEYLSLIYGVNFDIKFEYNYERRNISRKLRSSIYDFTLWKGLLNIPYNELTKDNVNYMSLLEAKVKQGISNLDNDTRL